MGHDFWDTGLNFDDGESPILLCGNCGIAETTVTTGLPCPPWRELTKGENTDAKRAHEAELIESLKGIVSLFEFIYQNSGHDTATWLFDKFFLKNQILDLKKLIQKHEG